MPKHKGLSLSTFLHAANPKRTQNTEDSCHLYQVFGYKAVCTFKFPKKTRREFILEGIRSAIFNAECVFGKPRVKVSGVAYYVDKSSPWCIIDVSNEVGTHVAQVFTGIMINTLGEENFQVKRIEHPARTASHHVLQNQVKPVKSDVT